MELRDLFVERHAGDDLPRAGNSLCMGDVRLLRGERGGEDSQGGSEKRGLEGASQLRGAVPKRIFHEVFVVRLKFSEIVACLDKIEPARRLGFV
jgi:hypothetical protein